MPKSIENTIMDSFELVKENYAKFLLVYLVIAAISVLVLLVLVALFVLGFGGSIAIGNLAPLVGVILFGIAVLFLISPFWAGIYYSLALQGLEGSRISVYEAIGLAKKKYVELLLTSILQMAIFVVVDAVIFSPLVPPILALLHAAGGSAGLGLSSMIGQLLKLMVEGMIVFVAFLVAMFILMPLLYEAVPLVLLEDLSGTAAIKRSVEIGKGSFWKLVWLFTVFWFAVGIVYVGEWIVTAIFGVLGQVLGVVAGIVLSVAVGALVAAWSYILPVVFYKEFVGRKGR